MTTCSVAALVQAIIRGRILVDPAQREELVRVLQPRCADAHALAKDLLRREWLTAYQVNQLLQGHGHELRRGSYILLERLGKGGMGQVYKAQHEQLGRIVALKVIHEEQAADLRVVRRFHREIQALAQLAHPHVVRAFDADQEAGVCFFVMEYVAGVDLGELVETHGPLGILDACTAVRQAALGLQHAHEHGLVHRDVKPSNLLRAEPGGIIKLLDLGLARLQEWEDEAVDCAQPAAGRGRTMLTQMGKIIGTPDFMAPEQARDSHRVDIRADLYSLGCTFYYLLTGRAPFAGGGALEKLVRHQAETAPPVEQLRADTPAAVGCVVRCLMAKRPEDRYQTPAALAAALDVMLRDLRGRQNVIPVSAVPASPAVLPLATGSRTAARSRSRCASFPCRPAPRYRCVDGKPHVQSAWPIGRLPVGSRAGFPPFLWGRTAPQARLEVDRSGLSAPDGYSLIGRAGLSLRGRQAEQCRTSAK